MEDCVFCKKIKDERLRGEVVVFEPLNPVTKGHLLVVPRQHVTDFSDSPRVSATTMRTASILAKMMKDVNLITSKGEHATQSVHHLHVHLVPRTESDGLQLPWSNQQPTPNTKKEN